MLYRVLVALILLTAFKLFVGRKKRPALNSFSREATIPLRGLLALMVVFGHLAVLVDLPWVSWIGYGTPAVAVFFFMSGYGLERSYEKKGVAYLGSFVRNSVRKLLVPLILLSALYLVCRAILGQDWSFIRPFVCSGETPLPHSWYVYALFAAYLVYYVVWSCVSERFRIGVFVLCTIVYMALIECSSWSNLWAATIISMPLGMLWARYELDIMARIRNCAWRAYLILAVLLAAALVAFHFCSIEATVFKAVHTWLLGPVAVMLLYVWRLPRGVLYWLGGISFEIYLVHGCFEVLFRNTIGYVLTVVACSLVAAWSFRRTMGWLLNWRT